MHGNKRIRPSLLQYDAMVRLLFLKNTLARVYPKLLQDFLQNTADRPKSGVSLERSLGIGRNAAFSKLRHLLMA